MSKSILKSNWVMMKPGETRIIDSNGIAEEKLKSQAEMFYQPDLVDENFNNGFNDGFVPGLSGIEYEEIPDEHIIGEDMTPMSEISEEQNLANSAQELVEQAQAQVEELKQQALLEIEKERQNAIEDGRQQGYEEGFNQGKTDGFNEGKQEGIESLESQKEEMLRQLAISAAEQNKEFQDKLDSLEPMMVETLVQIYEKVFQIELKKSKDIVVHLLNNAMHNVEGVKTFLIHASKEDYPLCSMQKKEIIKGTNIAVENVDIIEDSTLSKGECMIETENGIFDCSLDTQLETLNEQLILLSYRTESKNESDE